MFSNLKKLQLDKKKDKPTSVIKHKEVKTDQGSEFIGFRKYPKKESSSIKKSICGRCYWYDPRSQDLSGECSLHNVYTDYDTKSCSSIFVSEP